MVLMLQYTDTTYTVMPYCDMCRVTFLSSQSMVNIFAVGIIISLRGVTNNIVTQTCFS